MHGGQEVVRRQGLHAEGHSEAPILVLGVPTSADHQYRHLRLEGAQLLYELRACHARHEVVRDDQVDVAGVLVAAELFQGALRVEHSDDEVACPFEDRLACGGLHGVVVDQKKCALHAVQRTVLTSETLWPYRGARSDRSPCRICGEMLTVSVLMPVVC